MKRKNKKDKFETLFNDEGKFIRWPAQLKYQTMVINYLHSILEGDKEFTENEINQFIKSNICFYDHVTVRKNMVGIKALIKIDDGRAYYKNNDYKRLYL
ncbi:MAG: DUF2087 domain-containing protein [Candidatus Tenebribacter davisii]|nr:DUF2087 domain-containing protein [Candidatus Tenebribacter davisii]